MKILSLSFFLINSFKIIPFKFKNPPQIDGIISEFEGLEEISNFIEYFPEEGKKPKINTKCYIAYDENNIYFAFKCYDDMRSVRKTLTKRGEFAMDDMIFIYLDPYAKEKEGYIFATNPLGVQFDGIISSPPENTEDFTFDTYFEVKSFISDSFWSCEFRIPFSSLRLPIKEKQEWKFFVLRVRPRNIRELYVFPPISKNVPSFFAQAAEVIIPERIYSKEKRNDFIPYLISYQTGI